MAARAQELKTGDTWAAGWDASRFGSCPLRPPPVPDDRVLYDGGDADGVVAAGVAV